MYWYLVPIAVVLILVGGYLSLISSRPPKESQTAPFLPFLYAHRGLHTADRSVPENSMAAFAQAVEHGYGIELDVRLSGDGKVVVSHDDSLERMCGSPKMISDLSYEDLSVFCLGESEERIPLFLDVLKVVKGSVPLIVELKSSPRRRELCEKVLSILRGYDGPYCIESFDPRIVRWFSKHAKKVLRGQLADRTGSPSLSRLQKFFYRNLLMNIYAKPHFIAYRHDEVRLCRNFFICKKWFHLLTVAWTIRCEEELSQARDVFDLIIFENFIPGTKNELEAVK